MDKTSAIWIIVPVFNEAAIIRDVVKDVLLAGFENILIVDDGSREEIFSAVQNLPIAYIRHRVNLGQGAALQTGFNYALKRGAEVLVTFDADGQHDPSDINKIIEVLQSEGLDVVLGSRFLRKDDSTSIAFSRKFVLQLARVVNYLFSGILLTDAHNGLRAFNANAAKKIHISENRMAHATEILLQIRRYHLQFREIPVNIRYTLYSKRKGQSGWDSIKIVFDLLLHKMFK